MERVINELRMWLDTHAESEPSWRVTILMRILKVQEEAGEVASAVVGATGQNPRKGVTHSWHDVMEELTDVAVTAMVAMATIDHASWYDIMNSRVQLLRERAQHGKGIADEPWESGHVG